MEGLAGFLAKRGILVDNAGGVERVLHPEHVAFGGFEHGVEAAEDRHGQDDVAVLAANVEVAEHVVGDAPDEVRDPGDVTVGHA